MKTSKITLEKINQLITLDNYFQPTKAVISHRKLSDFYNSRSTNYASCLNASPFIHITSKEEIVKLGYSKLCKTVVTLDANDAVVIDLMKEKLEKRITEIENEKIRAIESKRKTQNTLAKWDSVKERFAKKWLQKNNGQISISHKEANQLAWKKQNYIEGGADLVTLRSLIKDYFYQLSKA